MRQGPHLAWSGTRNPISITDLNSSALGPGSDKFAATTERRLRKNSTIGFSALFISPIVPMRTVGFTMIVGVICSFFLTVSMTPAIMRLTNYSRHKSGGWKKIAIFSTKQWKAILN